MKCLRLPLSAILASLALSYPYALADKVILTNGETIEGIITAENTKEVELNIGAGSTVINRNKIKSVERSGDDANSELMAKWQKDFFLNKRNVPTGLEDIAEGFKKLAGCRADLIQAMHSNVSSGGEIIRSRDELADLQKKMLEATAKLRSASTNDITAYNAAVTDLNALSADITLKHARLEKLNSSSSAFSGQISSYLEALSSFKTTFHKKREEYAKGAQDEARTYLFEKLSGKLAEFEKECTDYRIPFTVAGKSVVVKATANKVTGNFIIDTGASMITISQSFANRANASTNNTGKFQIFLADGSSKTVPSVWLDSFQVGDAKVEKLEALVVPSGVGGEMDGLVGMNFLQHFQMHLDAANGKLSLRQLKPK